MDVSTISNVAAQNVGQFTAQKNSAASKIQSAVNAYANSAKTDNAQDSANAAFSVNISDAAKQAQAQETDDLFVGEAGAEKTKGLNLTADQLQSLKDEQEATMINLMIQVLTDNNNKLQGWLDEGTGILNFGGLQIDASRFALPSVATNAEDAAAAVADGGEWSVGAVSDRIFGLAELFAGGDPEKLEEMRAAVEEGFKQAGAAWNTATGSSNMPDITQKTYAEIMNRFDNAKSKLTGGTID
ncbi:MAG: hypothetical protein IJT73_09760 [Selenomonadaceae bacterium]|nr:hypothetical protein [Selenomonadaceae bacterium]